MQIQRSHVGAKAWATVLLLSLFVPTCRAAISTGALSSESRITGRLRPGDAAEARKIFAQGIDRPLLINLQTDSDTSEVLRLGDWLSSQHPILDFDEQCVSACAWLVLNSGRALAIRSGTVIAFGAGDFLLELMRKRIETGELFADASVTAASRERFLARMKLRLDSSQAMSISAHQRWPAALFDFVQALPGRMDQDRLNFDEQNFNYSLQGEPGHCLYWVPDAEGLRQLGLNVPLYQPATRAAVAKLLKVREEVIYVGPMVDPLPPQGLCAQQP